MSPFRSDTSSKQSMLADDDAKTLRDTSSSKAPSSSVTLEDPMFLDYYTDGKNQSDGHKDVTAATVQQEDERRQDEKRLIRTLDWHILPLFCTFYFVDYLDRANIGNATYVLDCISRVDVQYFDK